MLCREASRLLVFRYCPKVNPTKLTPAGQRCAVVAGQSSAPAKLNAPSAEHQPQHNPTSSNWSTSAGPRNDPVRSRRSESSVQVHDRVSHRKPVCVSTDVGIERAHRSALCNRSFRNAVLVTYGAKLNYLINAPNNQWWRFITPMFVHIDVLHLLMNMFSLLILGPFVEKLYGSAKFVVFWVVTGIAGVVGSYLALRPSLARGLLGSFHFQRRRRAFGRRFRSVVWTRRRSVCVWDQVSARASGRVQARVWHGPVADHLHQLVHWFCGAQFYR